MDANIQRALNDRLYDKRKIGALEYVLPLTPSLPNAFEPHIDSFLCFNTHYGPSLGPGDLLLPPPPPLLQKYSC